MRGLVLYEGPSVLTDDPIVAIATFKTKNRKTGPMIQTWILTQHHSPVNASRTGEDSAVCGICPLRHYLNGPCYVVIAQAPQQVWTAYKRGVYETFSEELHSGYFKGRSVRLGAYGDPAAVPFEVWSSIVNIASSHTGYTHQASHPRFDRRITSLCMVSADTKAQAKKYQQKGFSTFRVRSKTDSVEPNEIACINQVNEKIKCATCLLCSGKDSTNISAVIHGSFQHA